MRRQVLFLLLIFALASWLIPRPASAQITPSAQDTFKIATNIKIAPGATGAIKLYVANHTTGLASVQAFVRVDTTRLELVGVLDPDSSQGPPIFYATQSVIERGLVPDLFSPLDGGYPLQVTTTRLNRFQNGDIFFVILGFGDRANVPIGSGNVVQFLIKVKPSVPLGTIIPFSLFDPDLQAELQPEFRSCSYGDSSGLINVQRITLVSGSVDVDTGAVIIIGHNSPPTISGVPSTLNVQQGNLVSFTVSASDPDAPQQITLKSLNRPVGATFGTNGQVVGAGFASGSFSWSALPGSYTVTFTCQDDSGATATPKSCTINVGTVVPTTDLLYSASSDISKQFAGGIPGVTGISIPVNLTNLVDVYGVQFDFKYDPNVLAIDSLVQTDRLPNFTVYDNIGIDPGRVRVVAFDPAGGKVQAGTNSAMFNFWVSVKPAAPTGKSPIRFENSWEAISPSPLVPSVKLDSDTTGVFIVDIKGDVNGDGRVDIADVVSVVASIISNVTLNTRQFNAADMNNDNIIDVVDLVAIINTIFGGNPPNAPQWNGPDAQLALSRASGISNLMEVNANLPTDISGVQLEISYNPSKLAMKLPHVTDLSSGLDVKYRDDYKGKMVILLYPSTSWSSRIAAGSGTLLRLPFYQNSELSEDGSDFRIASAVLSDPNATAIPVKGLERVTLPDAFSLQQNFPNPFNPETTIEFSVGAKSAFKRVKLVVYNLLGARVTTIIDKPLAAGRYSYKWNGKDDRGQQMSSGVYFYRLSVGDLAQTKKMVLLK
jgi:hypothetical protein